MVLRPLTTKMGGPDSSGNKVEPAWSAVAERQKCHARGYWLISQPDHARLSGDLAANFVSQSFPRIDSAVARAIGVHDAGWAVFPQESSPSESPRTDQNGKPLAFIEFQPQEFLRAWAGSIDRAEGICAAGGIIVSRHFCALGEFRLRSDGLSEDERQLLSTFTRREGERQQHLLSLCSSGAAELEALLQVLQFCDLLSLYLCSGAQAHAEFPQHLTDRPVRIRHGPGENIYRLDPSPFQADSNVRVVSLGVSARYFPAEGQPKSTTLGFLLC